MGSTDEELLGNPTFSLTPHGVLAHVPLIEVSGLTIGVMGFTQSISQTRPQSHQPPIAIRFGLLLTLCPRSTDPLRPLYDIGMAGSAYLDDKGAIRAKWVRLVPLGSISEDLTLFGEPVVAQWKDIYLAHHPPPELGSTSVQQQPPVLLSYGFLAPFRFPENHVEEFIRATPNLRLDLVRNPPDFPWHGLPPVVFAFTTSTFDWTLTFILRLGRCRYPVPWGTTGSIATRGWHARWARVDFYPFESANVGPRAPSFFPPPGSELEQYHDCENDHVKQWPHPRKTFQTGDQEVTLTLTPCPINPTGTFVVNISARFQGMFFQPRKPEIPHIPLP